MCCGTGWVSRCRSIWCRRPFIWRERLPLTANSKIDKKTLTKLAGELGVVEDDYDAPAYADRETAGGGVGDGARRPAGPDRPAWITSSTAAAPHCRP